MLIPNLAVLLAERHLTISKVSEDTHLSRTTLTALTGGSAKGIQFETLNTLCQYLKVTPGELFTYRPFDLSLSADGLPGRSAIQFTVRRVGRREERCQLACDAQYIYAPDAPRPTLDALRLRLSLPEEPDPAQAERSRALVELLRALPAPILADLELQILRAYDQRIDPALIPQDYSPELIWPWQAGL